jgi:protein-arginine kinase activator protein McsA
MTESFFPKVVSKVLNEKIKCPRCGKTFKAIDWQLFHLAFCYKDVKPTAIKIPRRFHA